MAGEDSWKYERIAGDLRARIRSGAYAPGAQLPSKSELRHDYETSDGPVNEALRMLREEGLVETRHGKGTFVCDPLPEVARSEYETLMGRVNELAEEVRLLRGEVAELRKSQEA